MTLFLALCNLMGGLWHLDYGNPVVGLFNLSIFFFLLWVDMR